MAESGKRPDGSWVPAFEGQRPPFAGEPGPGRPAMHGAYSEAALAPLRIEVEQHLVAHSPEYAAADDHARRVLANQLARCEVAQRWLNEHGLVDEKGEPRPLLAELVKWEKASVTLMRELGMTTTSRVALELDRLQLERETVTVAEFQAALQLAMEAALGFVPRERRRDYLVRVGEMLDELGAGEDAPRQIEP